MYLLESMKVEKKYVEKLTITVTKKVTNESKKGKIVLFHHKVILSHEKLQGMLINQEVKKTTKSKIILHISHEIKAQAERSQTSEILIFLGQKTFCSHSSFINSFN